MKIIFELKITLDHTNPAVWRRLMVPDMLSLYELHHAIQIAFGWENYHAYDFKAKDRVFGNPVLLEDTEVTWDKEVFVCQVLGKEKDKMEYEYDFGDSWIHSIEVERIGPNDADTKLPVCLDGAMACPPEDCGGIPGYQNLIETMKSTKHPEYDDLVAWLGKPFDPEEFNLQKVNRELKQIKKHIREYEAPN